MRSVCARIFSRVVISRDSLSHSRGGGPKRWWTSRCQRAEENLGRIYPGSGSGYAGAPGISPFLSKGRDAGGAASRKLITDLAIGEKTRKPAPPTRLLPLCRSPPGQSTDHRSGMCSSNAGRSAGAPVARAPSACRYVVGKPAGTASCSIEITVMTLTPSGSRMGERMENIPAAVNKIISQEQRAADMQCQEPCMRPLRSECSRVLTQIL